MRRKFLVVLAAGVLVGPAFALRVGPPPTPAQNAITAPVIVIGKVNAIEKDLVEVQSPYPGAKDKQSYKLAVVKVESVLSGAGELKEIKVGVFQPKPVPGPGKAPLAPLGPAGPPARVELKEGQQLLFFLIKHPHADFYLMPGFNAPVDVTNEAGKKAIEDVKKVVAVLADPLKALKSDKPEVRTEAALVMVTKYRTGPQFVRETEPVAIGLEESKLILKALAEGEWKARFDAPNAYFAFNQLGLTLKDGWVAPVIVNPPAGQPRPDYAAIYKDAFTKWLDGPGKDYQIKKLVPKKQ
jgi:hypothetical protein